MSRAFKDMLNTLTSRQGWLRFRANAFRSNGAIAYAERCARIHFQARRSYSRLGTDGYVGRPH